MPANNSKIMSDSTLAMMKNKYKVEYDKEKNEMIVSLSTCARKTRHTAKQSFHINSKVNPKRKVCFSIPIINIFIECQNDPKTKDITIFDIQNAATSLKVMYQRVTKQSVVNFVNKKFDGIKKI